MRRVSDTGAFVYVKAARARGPGPLRHGADPKASPNCVRDVETDIPGPGGPRLWHH